MKKINVVGALVEVGDWLFHPIANYKELKEYREDYEREVLDFHKRIERAYAKIGKLAKRVQFYEKREKKRSKK
jgi:hypothetical protein